MSGGIRGYLEALRILRVSPPVSVSDVPSAVSDAIRAGQAAIQRPAEPGLALTDASLGEFEVNMMECLVGWKGWGINANGLLYSPSQGLLWLPDKVVEARCQCAELYTITGMQGGHSCGIYALDAQSRHYGIILGQVYGWGRYLRGSEGWRAQFAYPKCFYLTSDQSPLIETLKKYHVDIYVEEPLRIYSAEEDGYGHGEIEETGRG